MELQEKKRLDFGIKTKKLPALLENDDASGRRTIGGNVHPEVKIPKKIVKNKTVRIISMCYAKELEIIFVGLDDGTIEYFLDPSRVCSLHVNNRLVTTRSGRARSQLQDKQLMRNTK